MSNRTLIEINHDYAGKIDEADLAFVSDLVSYLRAGGERNKQKLLQNYGVRIMGMRHHSDGYDIKWGHCATMTQEPSQV